MNDLSPFLPPECHEETYKFMDSDDDEIKFVSNSSNIEKGNSSLTNKRKRNETNDEEQKKKSNEKPKDTSNRKKANEKVVNKKIINLKDKMLPFISSPSGFGSNDFWRRRLDQHLKELTKMTPEELKRRAEIQDMAHAEADRVSRLFEQSNEVEQPRNPNCKVAWPDDPLVTKEYLMRFDKMLPTKKEINARKEAAKKNGPSTSGEKPKRGRPKKDDEIGRKYSPIKEQLKRKEERERELLKKKEESKNEQSKEGNLPTLFDNLVKKNSPIKEPAKKDLSKNEMLNKNSPKKELPKINSPKDNLFKKYLLPTKESLKIDSRKNELSKFSPPPRKIIKTFEPVTAEIGVQTEMMEVDLPPFKPISFELPDMNNSWNLLMKHLKQEQENFKILIKNMNDLNLKLIEFRKSMIIKHINDENDDNSQNFSQKTI
ncbi:hypothetical protein PVAND_006295 [Polypedilum vanderplanki]|uniref:Uncharacterized protein n=1 Tax=Polypedilum vanderplanki TaxID=319348 RepID=A0A9J6C374_POLVA|nr:hypothetical protein PVAND_006295 [Polypedilum vanderplanki]